MRSPRRLSSPTTSERRRPRSEPSERPVSFRGIWTRLPSARIATATWRRLRPSNRPKVVSTECPADPGGSRSLRGVGCSRNHPRADGVAELLLGGSPSGPTAGPHSQIRDRRSKPRDRRRIRRSRCPRLRPRGEDFSSAPALSRLENESGACERREHQHNSEGLRLQHASHVDQLQRRPAPRVRASDAMSATVPVKRARFAFTMDSFVSLLSEHR
jgi:hypothetical protein